MEWKPDVVIGGSIALNAVGLLNRPVGDIDLFVETGTAQSDLNMLKLRPQYRSSVTVTNIMGQPVSREGFELDGVKICMFRVPRLELACTRVEAFGMQLNIQNVNHAIIAKKTYAHKTEKHALDYDNINRSLASTFD